MSIDINPEFESPMNPTRLLNSKVKAVMIEWHKSLEIESYGKDAKDAWGYANDIIAIIREQIAREIRARCVNGRPDLPYYDWSKSSIENYMTCACRWHETSDAIARGQNE